MEVYLLGVDGTLDHAWQTTAGAAFEGWQSWGGPWPVRPAAIANADGRLESFVWGQDRALYHLWQGALGGAYGLPQAFRGG